MGTNLDSIFIDRGQWNVQYLEIPSRNGESSLQLVEIPDNDSLEKLFSLESTNDSKLGIFIVRQQNSWGRLQICPHSFQRILSWIQAADQWWHFVRSFGFKKGHDDEDFGGYDRSIRSAEGASHAQYDVCYNLRYPEHIDRPHEYPWVQRQLAVYHSFQPEQQKSRWMLIQPSQTITDHLQILMQRFSSSKIPFDEDSQWEIHNLILNLTTSKWRSYINHIDREVDKFNDKACFSRVGRPSKLDYSVTFGDSQAFQQTRERLLRARSAIDQTMETLLGVRSHFAYGSSRQCHLNVIKSQQQVLQTRLRTLKQAVQRLLDVSAGTSKLLLKILDFRNDEALQRESGNTHAILKQSEKHTQALYLAAEKTHIESRTMRILTWMAIIYLPANLIASIFSTNLVQNCDCTESNAPGQLRSYLAITFGLMIATILLSVSWQNGLWAALLTKITEAIHHRQTGYHV